MQKIIIKNFGPIQEAEIELKKVLVLIGEQASGKSTIAKLIYFFKTLRQDFSSFLFLRKSKDFVFEIQEKFYQYFGSPLYLQTFEITFYYNVETNKYIKLNLLSNKKLNIEVSNDFLNKGIDTELPNWKGNSQLEVEYLLVKATNLPDLLFEINQKSLLFVIAGRNATVNYSELFEKYLFAHVQNKIENYTSQSLAAKSQTIEEMLMLKFIENVSYLQTFFRKNQGFDAYIKYDKIGLSLLKQKIEKILKGKYSIDNAGEKIMLNESQSVYLSQASSGQQEVIRILQDIFVLILLDTKALRIIEEPEAHLFPVAQKHLIELLAYMVNHDEDNQLIITTHSPYMLTIFNNLLFADRVVEKNAAAEKEVNEIIEKAFWLKASDFSAYSLGNQSFGEDAAYCESIFNEKTGMIQQNYLDDVSEMLGSDFQALMNIHAKTFAR